MISLVSLCALYVGAILVGKRQRGHATAFILLLIAIAQAAIVLTAMFLMDPPALVKGVH